MTKEAQDNQYADTAPNTNNLYPRLRVTGTTFGQMVCCYFMLSK